ncbi:MAG TPA: hypothetical protein VIF82_00645 [Burkholderiaceae bacterium]
MDVLKQMMSAASHVLNFWKIEMRASSEFVFRLMSMWRKILVGLFIVACLGLAIFAVAIIFGMITSPFSYNEMDFDNDGQVTFSEIVYGSAFRKNEVEVEEKKCIQYISLKDGRILKVVCHEK